ncbi:MAG: hypothetical protein FD153_2104 [Rhodospirillaceae bacterium]|nr:MAG: hypothetical protein FD153_2104 [Rhodospirillaceae bacterium]
MRFLNPRTGFAFKRIFGSDDSWDILLSFLNAAQGLSGPGQIVEVSILAPIRCRESRAGRKPTLTCAPRTKPVAPSSSRCRF